MRLITNIFTCIIALIGVAGAQAAADYNNWTRYPVFASGDLYVIDTDDMVYFANTGLFSYNKKSHDQESYVNRLNSTDINGLYRNNDRHFLAVTYADANIDLVYDDGHVVNIPAIAASNHVPCTINDIVFAGDNMFVATSFGLVKINAASGEVIQSGIFNKNVPAIGVTDTHLLITIDNYMRTLPIGNAINNLANFHQVAYIGNARQIHPIDNTHLLVRTIHTGEYALRVYTLNDDTTNLLDIKDVYSSPVPEFIITPSMVCVKIGDKIHSVDANGTLTLQALLPDDYATDQVSFANTPADMWALNAEGITNIGADALGGITILADRFLPDAIFTKEIDAFAPTKKGEGVYIYNIGASAYKPVSTNYQSPLRATYLNIANGATQNATPYPVDALGSVSAGAQNTNGKYPINPSMIATDPDDPHTYYLATANDGVYKIKNGERVGYFDSSNSPLKSLWGCNAFGVHVDRGGNLWVVTYQTDGSSLALLPSALRSRPTDQITKDDWVILDDGGFAASSDVAFLECQRSGMIFITSHTGNFQLLAYDTNNTPANFSDDKAYLWNSMTDQDGKSWTPERKISLAEDLNGRVWFGTNRGIYQITSPSQATNPSMRFQKLKVPRNDGTNEADYLLDNDMVYSITVDSKNRKWIATENTGLVCANEAGNAIIQTYNPENSPLMSNRVMSVWADRKTDEIYVGTLSGLLSLSASVASSTDSFSDILAYPNPVRPDYSGPIFIRGLMDNTLVKIIDSAGSVINQGRAENGVYRWDGCDRSGQRAKTGVYFVFVSAGGEKSSSAVTKIMVIN